jgi:hypothetical protein
MATEMFCQKKHRKVVTPISTWPSTIGRSTGLDLICTCQIFQSSRTEQTTFLNWTHKPILSPETRAFFTVYANSSRVGKLTLWIKKVFTRGWQHSILPFSKITSFCLFFGYLRTLCHLKLCRVEYYIHTIHTRAKSSFSFVSHGSET